MDPAEIIKATPELVKVVAPVAAAIPFTGLVKRMLGPAADELAQMWRDQVRLYRYERQIKCIEKAEKMARDAGFTPRAVPPKILFPLVEGASFEENETLHDMWAALLANASSDHSSNVRPFFIATLKQMSPDEAMILNVIPQLVNQFRTTLVARGYDASQIGDLDVRSGITQNLYNETMQVIDGAVQRFRASFPRLPGEDDSAEKARFELCIDTLRAADLVELFRARPILEGLRLTALGKAFVAACSAPKPKP